MAAPTEMEDEKQAQRAPAGNSLLLHMCCGPCACICIERMQAEGWNITGYFMNPNIQPLAEYLRRREAAVQCAAYFGIPILFEDNAWNLRDWLRAVRDCDEPPARCTFCVTQRMQATYEKARILGFTHFTSSLLYSKYQPHEAIRLAGIRCSAMSNGSVLFLDRDFRNEWENGIALSRQIGIYRQPYCGCVYSETDRYRKKLDRLIEKTARS